MTGSRNHRLAVLGAGTMGVAIATLAVGRGVPTILVDVDPDRVARAEGLVRGQLRLAKLMGALDRATQAGELTVTGTLDGIGTATAVVESVTEDPAVKALVVAEVAPLLAPDAVLMTNTSGIPVDEVAGWGDCPDRVLGAHFMNPPYLIRAIEVVRGPRTSDAALADALALLTALDREPVVVGDGPGFVINRILQRMINEAARIVEEGIASPDDVDRLFTGCLGHRTGPLATADLIGLDNVADSLRVLHERTGDEGYRPCDLLAGKVSQGMLGRKSGRGFHDYGEAQQ